MDTQKREFELEIEIVTTEKRLQKLREKLERAQYEAVKTGEKNRAIPVIEEEIRTNERLLTLQKKAIEEIRASNEVEDSREQKKRESLAEYYAKMPAIIERLEKMYDTWEAIERDTDALIEALPPEIRTGNIYYWRRLPKVQSRRDWHILVLKDFADLKTAPKK